MKRIFKYPLERLGRTFIEAPRNAQWLQVAMKDGVPNVWAVVDPDTDSPTMKYTVEGMGTGHPMDFVPGPYLGSVVERQVVWHFFMTDRQEVKR